MLGMGIIKEAQSHHACAQGRHGNSYLCELLFVNAVKIFYTYPMLHIRPWIYQCVLACFPYCTNLLPFFRPLAMFQWLMDRVLQAHNAYAAAYLDEIISFNNDQLQHVQHVRAVLKSWRQASLMVDLAKCVI